MVGVVYLFFVVFDYYDIVVGCVVFCYGEDGVCWFGVFCLDVL